MIDEAATAPLPGGVALLERAISYTLGSLNIVTADAMARPTPCRAWDLRALLDHMNDSLAALSEAIDVGHIQLDESAAEPGSLADPVAVLRNRACRLVGGWANAHSPLAISVAGAPLTAGIVACTGAVEVAVHGWDVAAGCGLRRPIPSSLAEEMLQLAPLFVTEADRPVRFAAPVDVSPRASPGDQLLALLGRQPGSDLEDTDAP